MSQTRQLNAILFADIQNFTAIVQQDESGAKLLKDKFHKVVETEVKKHHGRIVNFAGDGVFCVFRSAVSAVLASIDIQLQMTTEPIVPLRIGIHLGDVIVESKDIFGDAVNVASRVESFSVPGAVLITDLIFHEVKNHPEISTSSLGLFEFKNVNEHVEIFAVTNKGLTVPEASKLKGKGKAVFRNKYKFTAFFVILILIVFSVIYFNYFRLSTDDKSIAVVPFKNLSNDPREEYLSDGITEDILTSLANISDLKITSFASTSQYKGSKKNIKQIAKELNVAYILEGSVQRWGNKLRITAQLIDGKNEYHIWANNYDEPFSEVLSIQTKVSNEIASSLKAKLTAGEKKRIDKVSTHNTEAYKLYLMGRYHQNLRTKNNLDTAIQFFEKAIKKDPDYALAYSGIADSYTILFDNGYLPFDSIASKAKAAVNKALLLDSSLAEVKASYAIYLSSIEGNGTAAIKELDNIVKYNPNYASAFQWYAIELTAKGRFNDAVEMINKAIVLDPRSKRIYFSKALIYFFKKDYNQSIAVLKSAPDNFSTDANYIYFLSQLYYFNQKTDSAKYFAKLCNNEILLLVIKKDKARLKQLILEKSLEHRFSAEEIATFYTMANEKDSAFAWLKKSIANKEYGGLKFLALNPFWDPLRSDYRFSLLLQNSGIQ